MNLSCCNEITEHSKAVVYYGLCYIFQGLIDDDDVEGEPRAKKPGKKSKRKTTKTTIFDVSHHYECTDW